jgi:hypothetical protein
MTKLRLAGLIVILSPVYVTFAIFFGKHYAGWQVFLPFALVFAPAGAILAGAKCKTCKEKIYTKDTIKGLPKVFGIFPTPLITRCPNCDRPL